MGAVLWAPRAPWPTSVLAANAAWGLLRQNLQPLLPLFAGPCAGLSAPVETPNAADLLRLALRARAAAAPA
eukprot:905868-Lingulodinium_polyedra.AAC.1